MSWRIVFDRELENPVDTIGDFESYEAAKKYLDDLSYEELEEVFNEWCNNNGIEEDERPFTDDMQIVIYEMIDFTPKLNVDTLLDHLQDQASEFGGEYSEGYLEHVNEQQFNELEDALNDVYTKWAEKYNHQPFFYQIGQEKNY